MQKRQKMIPAKRIIRQVWKYKGGPTQKDIKEACKAFGVGMYFFSFQHSRHDRLYHSISIDMACFPGSARSNKESIERLENFANGGSGNVTQELLDKWGHMVAEEVEIENHSKGYDYEGLGEDDEAF